MKKQFSSFLTAWAVMLGLFNLITFAPAEAVGTDFSAGAFWVGYIFITLTFLGVLACAYVTFGEKYAQKLFYKLPLVSICYGGIIATFLVGGICMLIPDLPVWVCIILCSLVLAFNILSILRVTAAVGVVERVDSKVKQQTFFIRSLTVDAQGLVARAQDDAVLAQCKQVYEAVRYSDPMSSPMLAGVESQITIRFATLSEAVANNDIDAVCAAAKEVTILLQDRNNKCRMLKQSVSI